MAAGKDTNRDVEHSYLLLCAVRNYNDVDVTTDAYP